MKTLTKTILAAAAATMLAGNALAADAKACFVYVGPIGDFGWSYQHHQGLLAVEEAYGDKVETAYLESVPEGADAERNIERFARSGCNVIFTTSFGYMDPTNKVAAKFPDVKFEHATGFKRADNVSTYSARFYEGRTIQGHIAGSMTKSNIIGYIGSYPIPEVIRGINSAYLHAKKVNPDVQFKIIWVYTWFDPGKEADAAKALIAAGADIIMQHTDSPAALQAAENADGILAFGQASDMIKFAPNAQLTAIEDNWAPYYIKRVQAVLDGTWESSDSWEGLAANEVVMAPYWNMPYDVANMAKEIEADIRMGTCHSFEGPIVDRDGTERVAAGAVADDGMLLGMDFFVKGVSGDLPK